MRYVLLNPIPIGLRTLRVVTFKKFTLARLAKVAAAQENARRRKGTDLSPEEIALIVLGHLTDLPKQALGKVSVPDATALLRTLDRVIDAEGVR